MYCKILFLLVVVVSGRPGGNWDNDNDQNDSFATWLSRLFGDNGFGYHGNNNNGYGNNGYGNNPFGWGNNGYNNNGYGNNGYDNGYGNNGYGNNPFGWGNNGYNNNGYGNNGYSNNGYGNNGYGNNPFGYGNNGYGNSNNAYNGFGGYTGQNNFNNIDSQQDQTGLGGGLQYIAQQLDNNQRIQLQNAFTLLRNSTVGQFKAALNSFIGTLPGNLQNTINENRNKYNTYQTETDQKVGSIGGEAVNVYNQIKGIRDNDGLTVTQQREQIQQLLANNGNKNGINTLMNNNITIPGLNNNWIRNGNSNSNWNGNSSINWK